MSPIPSNKDQILALRAAQLEAGHGRNTRAQYRHWMLRYRRARTQGTCRSLQGFLTHLTTVEELNPKTIHQALCALKFYHEKVLGTPIAENSLTIPPINRNRNHPAYLSAPQAHALLSHLSGLAQLQASFLIGTGSRITAMLQLRLKDIDLHAGTVCFRFDKGRKSRSVRLPQSIIPALAAQIERSRAQWKLDRAAGIITGIDDPSLTRKLGKSLGTLPWYWLFPSQAVRQGIRWHATDRCLSDALKVAATAAGITARVTPHSLRHTNATLLLEQGANIRRIQEHLGHTHLETTEIYLHATASEGLASPLDRLPTTIPFPPSLHHQATA